MRRRKVDISMHPKYVRRRKAAVVVLLALCVWIGGAIVLAMDRAVQGGIDAMDAQAAYAVAESKRQGTYPYEQ